VSCARKSASALLLVTLLGISSAGTRAAETGAVSRGGRVGWARLVTGSSSWSVHDGNDPLLAKFIREQTSLNIDPTCYPVEPATVEKLCAYPLIFTNNLTNVRDAKHLENLREYLRRGGFIYIDRCVNVNFSLEQEPFYERHLALFAQFLPGAEVRELDDAHPINRCYFTTPPKNRGSSARNHSGMYGVFDGGRMVALLSNANFQCGWPQSRDGGAGSMKMIANIYVYAMTRAEEPPAPAKSPSKP
jgi:Domain of unknown function (DUF4159)